MLAKSVSLRRVRASTSSELSIWILFSFLTVFLLLLWLQEWGTTRAVAHVGPQWLRDKKNTIVTRTIVMKNTIVMMTFITAYWYFQQTQIKPHSLIFLVFLLILERNAVRSLMSEFFCISPYTITQNHSLLYKQRWWRSKSVLLLGDDSLPIANR